jgi:L-threonylcarbamoyladenylate synthase
MNASALRPAIFFDRDGTLIEDRGYIRSSSEVSFYEDTISALQKLEKYFLLFIVTNQPGIARGILQPKEVEEVNRYVVEILNHAGVMVSAVYICPHTRDEGCECIKPQPHFLLKAAREFRIDLSRSFVVGDHPHDVELARKVGAKGIYLLTGHGQKHFDELPPDVFVAKGMKEAIDWIIKTPLYPENTEFIRKAAEIIKRGGIVAFPTETVYGLGADLFNPLAVARIFEVKRRPSFDPLIVHVAHPADVEKLVREIPSDAKKLIEKFWPGPLTVVLLKTENVPDIVTAGLPTVAVRMPNHPMALSLIEQANCPIAAPSANPFGRLSPTTAEHVREQLGDQIDFILDGGACEVGVESTIVSFYEKKPVLLRPGGVPLEEIESIIGEVEPGSLGGERPPAPGMLPRHYAPRTPIILGWSKKDFDSYRNKKIGLLAFQEPDNSPQFQHIEVLSKNGDIREAAANLFSAIRRLDALHLDLILAEAVPEVGLGRAIMDRLHRASARSDSSGRRPDLPAAGRK